MKFAECIVKHMELGGNRLRGENGIRFAYYNGKSKKIVEGSNQEVRSQKSFGIIEKAHCPSILLEQCFITNSNDVKNWGSDKGCKKAAKIYYDAICDYYGTV